MPNFDDAMDAPQPELNIELDEETAEGTYSNLDFIRVVPGVQKARVKERIIITPQHAKRLLRALQDNVDRYEADYGDIDTEGGAPDRPFHFGGPDAKA